MKNLSARRRRSFAKPQDDRRKGIREIILINSDKIEEWVREVEQRPASAPLIIRYIASRLEELTRRDEELRV